jgi:RNA 2',3'-cyclic 3'-phosphodiesterase
MIMPRLFVAIRPPPAIRAQLIALQNGVEGARWQDDDQLHLTLRFIGDVDARTADDVLATLSHIQGSPFTIALNGVGTFDRKGRVETLWAGVKPPAPLAALHHKIDHALVRMGLPPEGRAYLPHITLARFGRSGGVPDAFLAAHAGLSSDAFAVRHFALFESNLGSGGARYDLVERWALC